MEPPKTTFDRIPLKRAFGFHFDWEGKSQRCYHVLACRLDPPSTYSYSVYSQQGTLFCLKQLVQSPGVSDLHRGKGKTETYIIFTPSCSKVHAPIQGWGLKLRRAPPSPSSDNVVNGGRTTLLWLVSQNDWFSITHACQVDRFSFGFRQVDRFHPLFSLCVWEWAGAVWPNTYGRTCAQFYS